MSRRKHVNPRKHILSMARAGKGPSAPPQHAPSADAAPPDAGPAPAYASGLPLQNRQAAGSDVGSFSHGVWVDADRPLQPGFPVHTDGLKRIAAWPHEYHMTTVALESSGVYWIPLHELLESEGFEVLRVDPSFTKQIKGRPKTDKRDGQWIRRPHAPGLLASGSRPDEDTCVPRSYPRQRAPLVRYAGQHIQHLQRAPEQIAARLDSGYSGPPVCRWTAGRPPSDGQRGQAACSLVSGIASGTRGRKRCCNSKR